MSNWSIKNKLAKMMATTKMECRATPPSEKGLSPYHLQTGRGALGAEATPTPNMVPGLPKGGGTPRYWKALNKSFSVFHQ